MIEAESNYGVSLEFPLLSKSRLLICLVVDDSVIIQLQKYLNVKPELLNIVADIWSEAGKLSFCACNKGDASILEQIKRFVKNLNKQGEG